MKLDAKEKILDKSYLTKVNNFDVMELELLAIKVGLITIKSEMEVKIFTDNLSVFNI